MRTNDFSNSTRPKTSPYPQAARGRVLAAIAGLERNFRRASENAGSGSAPGLPLARAFSNPSSNLPPNRKGMAAINPATDPNSHHRTGASSSAVFRFSVVRASSRSVRKLYASRKRYRAKPGTNPAAKFLVRNEPLAKLADLKDPIDLTGKEQTDKDQEKKLSPHSGPLGTI